MKNDKKKKKLQLLRHSTAHILATAVLKFFPEAKFAIGPSIENGFYYDFELPRPLIPEDLPLLEAEMKKIIKANFAFEQKLVPSQEALAKFKKLDQRFKVELIEDLIKEKNSEVSLYKLDGFIDLCSGPHIESSGEIDPQAFKLTTISSAYWRGDEKRESLQRIYGTVFENKANLKKHLFEMEEAKKRDHRKLGKDLDLFCFSDLVGPGLPLYTPKGTIIKEELQKHIESVCKKYGFQKVSTPSLAKPELFEISGHAKKFGDELFHVTSEKKHDLVLKPVQCPHQTQIYASKNRSYKDLPIRYMESDKQYRAEKTGEVGGLSRVYAITVEDGHSFCRVDQIKEEIEIMVNIIKDFYGNLGLWGNHWVSLSVRDYDHPEKYIGDTKDWDKCESMLELISKEMKLDAKKCEGEAALYGPKLDFMFKDATGREIQIPTIQLDFATPKKFGLFYIDETGKKVPPVMIHRAILGSYERLLALLIEHFAGAFPSWLAPVQVALLPVSKKFNDYSQKIAEALEKAEIRIETPDANNSLGKRIAETTKLKVPYILIMGEKEEKEDTVTIRKRGQKEQETLKIAAFVKMIKKEITKKI